MRLEQGCFGFDETLHVDLTRPFGGIVTANIQKSCLKKSTEHADSAFAASMTI